MYVWHESIYRICSQKPRWRRLTCPQTLAFLQQLPLLQVVPVGHCSQVAQCTAQDQWRNSSMLPKSAQATTAGPNTLSCHRSNLPVEAGQSGTGQDTTCEFALLNKAGLKP